MMPLDSQNNFTKLMEQKIHGQKPVFDAPYQELYELWENQNQEVVYRLSAEERTEAFSDFVEKQRKGKVEEILEAKDFKETNLSKEELKNLNQRGQLILASRDGGKTFDTLITRQDLEDKKIDPIAYTILSPTLTSGALKMEDVLDEQTKLYIVKNLKEQNFLVKNAVIKDGKVEVETTEPKTGETELHVFNVTTLEPIISNTQGEQHITKNALQGAYGQIARKEMEEKSGLETMESVHTIEGGDATKKTANAMNYAMMGIAGGLAIMNASKEALQIQNLKRVMNAMGRNKTVKQQKQSIKLPIQPIVKPSFGGNVQAAKAEVGAHFARKALEDKENEAHQQELQDQYQKDLAKQQKERALKEEEAQAKQQNSSMATGPKIGIGALAGAGGILAGTAGLTLFTVLQNNILS